MNLWFPGRYLLGRIDQFCAELNSGFIAFQADANRWYCLGREFSARLVIIFTNVLLSCLSWWPECEAIEKKGNPAIICEYRVGIETFHRVAMPTFPLLFTYHLV